MTLKNKTDFKKLRALLIEQETFPFDFTLKFIGKNSDAFKMARDHFESAHPILQPSSTRLSANQKHLAVTYKFLAQSADHIIEILEQVALLKDVLVIL